MSNFITNREFRDVVAEAHYPFADTALLANSQGVHITSDMFLDALIYSLNDHTQPFYISDFAIIQTNEMLVTIRDKNNKEICTGTIGIDTDTCYLYDNVNRVNGCLVYNPDSMKQLINRVGVVKQSFTKEQTSFLASRCFVTRSKGLSVVKADDVTLTENIYIVGANGINFSLTDDIVSIDMYGEEAVFTGGGSSHVSEEVIVKPIKTINGLPLEHVWLAAHPNSSLKVDTSQSKLKLWKVSDAE